MRSLFFGGICFREKSFNFAKNHSKIKNENICDKVQSKKHGSNKNVGCYCPYERGKENIPG